MKKLTTGLLAIASIVGVGTAFGNNVHFKKFATQTIYVVKTGSTLSYTDVNLNNDPRYECASSSETCTMTTSIALSTLNSSNTSALPTQQVSSHNGTWTHYLSSSKVFKLQ